MKRFLTLILPILLMSLIPLHAQSISGTVVEKGNGSPVAGAMVMLKNAGGAVVRYSSADGDGRFTMAYAAQAGDSCYIEVRMMGFRTEVIRPPFKEDMTVRMEVEEFLLGEVVVQAEKVEVRGDTISYSVPTLLSNDDRILGDILVKIPGIDVSSSGFVRYQGVPINRLYIDGNDLLESRYNIATKNIDPRDISSVQVYERHQPVKALEGLVESDKTALNITLKPGARGKWTATLQAEAGASSEKPKIPYSGSGFLMNISRKFQTVNTLKTDAAGNDIIRNREVSAPGMVVIDINDRDFANRYRARDYLSMATSSAPISAGRTRFNTSYSASTDNKFVLANGYTLGVTGDYENLTLSSEDYMEQTYWNEDGTRLTYFRDENKGASGGWYGAAAVKLNANTSRLYLNDHLRFSISGDRASNSLSGTSMRQEGTDGSKIELANSLSFITRASGTSAFSLSMLSQYAENSESLRVTAPGSGDTASQYIGTRFFYNNIQSASSFQLGRYISLQSQTGIEFLWRSFKTGLNGIMPAEGTGGVLDKTSNNLDFFYIRPRETLSLSLTLRNFKASLSVNAWYQYIRGEHHWAIDPGLNLKYTFGPRFWAIANASYRIAPIDEQGIYDGVIMQNYRYFTLGRDDMTGVPSLYAGGGLNFRDPLSGWYLRGYASYIKSRTFENTRYLIGEYIIQQQSDKQVPYSGVNAEVAVEKSFLDIAGKLSLEGGFNMFSTSMNQNGVYTDYTGYSADVSAGFSGDIARWLKLRYKGSYSYDRYMIEDRWSEDASHSFRQSLTLSFFPIEKLEVDISGEHYLDKYQEPEPRQTFFLDASAWFFVTDSFQIFLHARNLLDQKYYTYTFLSPLSTSVFSYRIRPLNVLLGFQIKF